jgi:hypothetical protein
MANLYTSCAMEFKVMSKTKPMVKNFFIFNNFLSKLIINVLRRQVEANVVVLFGDWLTKLLDLQVLFNEFI